MILNKYVSEWNGYKGECDVFTVRITVCFVKSPEQFDHRYSHYQNEAHYYT